MGSHIQLPALGIQAPQQPDVLGQVAKIRQIQGMGQEQQLRAQQIQAGQLENQLRQRQVQDQQTTMQILGKHQGDLESALPELASAVSAQTYIGLQKTALEMKKNAADLSKTDLENNKMKSDAMLGLIDSATQMDPQTYQQNWPQIAQRAVEIEPKFKGQIDPTKPVPQQALGQYGTLFQTQSTMLAKEAADRAAKEQKAKLPGEEADSAIKQAELAAMQGGGVNAKIPMEVQEANSWLKLHPGKNLSDYQKYKATLVPAFNFNLQNGGGTGTGGQPSDIAKGLADGSVKWQDVVSARTPMSVKQALLTEVKKLKPDFNSGDFSIEQKAKEVATSGTVGQQLLAIGTAREHMKTFRSLADALDNGNVQVLNKIGNAIGVQFGSDKKTNFDIAAQAFGGEVGKAFDGAGVVAGEREQAQKNFNAAMANGQFKGAIDIVDKLLAGKQKAAHDWFDKASQAKPDFGNEQAKPASGDFFSGFGGTTRKQ